MGAEGLRIEVVYALPRRQTRMALEVAPGTTIEEAIRRSGILERHPEIDLTRNKVGVYGRIRRLDETLAAGDRVEIYRELKLDPKDLRRQRARQQGL